MALATQCPHCQTTFRVAHDQLKLRAGLVRCGHCKEIFNGIEHLLPPEEAPIPVAAPEEAAADDAAATQTSEAEPSPTVATPSPVNDDDVAASANTEENGTAETASPASSTSTVTTQVDFELPPEFERESSSTSILSDFETRHTDPLLRMTLMDFAHELPDHLPGDTPNETADEINKQVNSETEEQNLAADLDGPDELDTAIADLQRKPWRGTSTQNRDDDEEDASYAADEPGFLKRGRRKQRLGKKLRTLLSIGCCILFIAALIQGTYLFRNQIASLFPQVKPLLSLACNAVGCRIDLPANIAEVSIESSELQTLADDKDSFILTTLIRNYSDARQTWPHIELTLNDRDEKPLLRRVFAPSDYLSDIEIRVGFAAGSEHLVKLPFELSQIKASGYRVYLFYP